MSLQIVLNALSTNGYNEKLNKCVIKGSKKVHADGKITLKKKEIPNLPMEIISKIITEAEKPPTMAQRLADWCHLLVERDEDGEFVVPLAEIKKYAKKNDFMDWKDHFSVKGKNARWGWILRTVVSKFSCLMARPVLTANVEDRDWKAKAEQKFGAARKANPIYDAGYCQMNNDMAVDIIFKCDGIMKMDGRPNLGLFLGSWVADIITEGKQLRLFKDSRVAAVGSEGWCPFTYQFGRGEIPNHPGWNFYMSGSDTKLYEDAQKLKEEDYRYYFTNKPTKQPRYSGLTLEDLGW